MASSHPLTWPRDISALLPRPAFGLQILSPSRPTVRGYIRCDYDLLEMRNRIKKDRRKKKGKTGVTILIVLQKYTKLCYEKMIMRKSKKKRKRQRKRERKRNEEKKKKI